MIDFVGKSRNTSAASREILMGLMHRVLPDESNHLIDYYTQFFLDNLEDRSQFSKFSVKFRNNNFNRYSDVAREIKYYNEVTHNDPEETIKETFEVRKRKEELLLKAKKEGLRASFMRKFTIKDKAQQDMLDAQENSSDDSDAPP